MLFTLFLFICPGQGSSSNATTRPKRNLKYKKASHITEVASQNNSEAKTLVKYDNNESLKIKQEMIEIKYENDETLDIKDEFTQGMTIDSL